MNDCIHCGVEVNPNIPHKVLTLMLVQKGGTDSGTAETMEEWPICADCQTKSPAELTRWVLRYEFV